MSKVADTLIGFEEAFNVAMDEYNLLTGMMEQDGYDVRIAMVAAQYYGQMVGIALAEESVFSPSPLMEYIRDTKPRLYKEDYEE